MLGYVRTETPEVVRRALEDLRKNLASDPLFATIPSFQKSTSLSFHAKNDSPEVRAEVFKLLRELPIQGQFIFARKRLSTFRNAFSSKEGRFYDHLVTRLFKRSLHLAVDNRIYFEKRGSRSRQKPLTDAVNRAVAEFQTAYRSVGVTNFSILSQTAVGEPCLQAADYFLWAVQRLFVRGEERFFLAIEDQVEFVWDLYDTERYPKNIYNRKTNPLRANKISPL